MSKVHEDNAGYVGVSYEETQDPFYSYNKLSLPLAESDKTVVRDEVTFTVTVAGGKFVIDGTSQATVSLAAGGVYTFDQSHNSNLSHPLRFSYTADGTHGGGQELTLGVTAYGTPGQSGAYTKIVVPFGLHSLKYYCSAHTGMGGSATLVQNDYAFTFGRPIGKTTDAFGANDPTQVSGTLTQSPANQTALPTYSNQGGGSANSTNPVSNAFDGVASTYADMTFSNGQWSKVTFATPITGVTSISAGFDGEGDIGYNGSVVNSSVSFNGSRQTISLYSGTAITLTDIYFVSQPGNGVCRFYDLTINGTEQTFSSSPAVSQDSFAANTRLAIPMNGANNGTAFADLSPSVRGTGSAVSITRTGAITKTDQSYFYGSSGYFDGSSYLTLGSLAGGSFNDFTFECWVRPNGTSQYGFFSNQGSDNAANTMRIGTGSGGGIWMKIAGTSLTTPNGSVPSNVWTHVAVVRKGILVTCFINGRPLSTMRNGDSITQTGFNVGRTYTSGSTYPFAGYMQDVRFYDFAKYTTPFPLGGYGMDVVTYRGNGATSPGGSGSTQNISYAFKPDLIWIKDLSQDNHNHNLVDSVRGTPKILPTDYDVAEIENSTDAVTAINNYSFSLGDNGEGSQSLELNKGGNMYVAFAWTAGTPANPVGAIWRGSATKYIGVKFPTASGGTVSYGQTTGTTTVEVWTSSDNSNWTQQGGTQTLSDHHTLTTSDQYVAIRNTSNDLFTDWYAAATDGADGHYSSQTYPSGASWSGPTYVDYDWRDPGGTINTDGSIPSVCRTSEKYGFSIVSFDFKASAENATMGHNLSDAPKFLIIKNRDTSHGYYVYTSVIDGSWDYGKLADNTAYANSSRSAATSTVFNFQGDASGGQHIAYVWSERAGFSKFGVYTGNASIANGTVVKTGFKPRWILHKRTDTTGNWVITDTARHIDQFVYANEPQGDRTAVRLKILDDGFQLSSSSSTTNEAGATYLYAAFAESAVGDNVFETALVDQVDTFDLSANANHPSNVGASWQSSVKRNYGGAAYFNGLSVIDVASSFDYSFGLGDFTIEFWIKTALKTNDGTYRRMFVLDGPTGDTGTNFSLNIDAIGGHVIAWGGNAGPGNIVSQGVDITDNQWHHVAAVRSGTTVTTFVDGSPQGSGTDSRSLFATATPAPRIGGFAYSSGRVNGYMQDVRVYKGVAKYTSSFSPPERSVKGTARRYPSGIYVLS